MAELEIQESGYPHESPNIDMEIYRLLSCLFASGTFSKLLSKEKGTHYWEFFKRMEFPEICRILISIAAITRNNLDLGHTSFEAQSPVGLLYIDGSKTKEPETLDFRQACNKILHASKVNPDVTKPSSGLASPLTNLVHLYGTQGKKNWHAVIDIQQFALIAINFT